MIKISDTVSLPLDAITQTFGVLAVRGAGKSNLAAVMAEGMFAAGLPFCVVDPVGSWWGLRSRRDGNGAGLPVPIFGGRHGDVPLERTGGTLIADLVVDRRLTCVLDVSELSESDKVRFLIDFAERLYRRNTDPLHLFLEEADDFIPQRPFREQARLLGAWENIVRRGRARGLGMTLITQRSAALNKNVLTQIETLFALRTTSPQDRAAIKAWVDYQGGAHEMLATLPKLEAGEAWVWSPSWLKCFERVRIPRRATFDSGATPKNAKGKRPVATLADVDLGAVRVAMSETIERAKQDDPKALRAEVAALRKQVAAKTEAKTETKCVEVPALTEADRKTLIAAIGRAEKAADQAAALSEQMRSHNIAALEIAKQLRAALNPLAHVPSFTTTRSAAPASRHVTITRTPSSSGQAAEMPKGELAVLKAAAQCGDGGASRDQITILTGYKRSTRDAYIQRARERGYLAEAHGNVVATPEGIAALGSSFEPLPTGDALREHWLGRLPEGERKVLAFVCDQYPSAADREVISEHTGYKRSTRDAYIQRLGVRKLVSADRDGVRASAGLFG